MINKDIVANVAECISNEQGISYREALIQISIESFPELAQAAKEMILWLDAEQEVEDCCSQWNL